MEIRKAIYGPSQAITLANKLHTEWLEPYGCKKVKHTPRMCHNGTCPVQFTLVVDNVGVKYTGREHAEYLTQALKGHYDLKLINVAAFIVAPN